MDEKNKSLTRTIKKAKAKYSENSYVLAVPGFLSRSFTSFCSMKEDLTIIKKYVESISLNTDELIISSLTYSIISLYGKCFTDATKNKSPKLESNQLFEGKEELRNTHEYLMNLRHHFISHRGDTESEVEVAYILIPKESGRSQVKYSRLKQISFNQDEREKIGELVEYLIQELQRKIQKAGQKTYEVILRTLRPRR